MTFHFTESELSYMVKKFGYKHLEGFDQVKFDKDACAEALLKKGYISPYKKSYELSNDVRLLLSAWANTRYTLVRQDCLSDDHIFAIFANSRNIITYSYHEGDIQVNLGDFSVEIMDKVISDYLNIVPGDDKVLHGFNITFTAKEFISYFSENMPNAEIAKKTGISPEDVALIKQTIDSEKSTAFILQNVVDDIGCLGTLAKHENGYVLAKHIVPNNDISGQRVVAVKGSAQDIIDSIYIL